jgi:predicted metal-dependent hydrolase
LFLKNKTIGEKSEINLDGKTVCYKLRISPNARHVRLEVGPETGLAVIVPRGYPLSKVPDIILNKKRWIITRLELYHRAKKDYTPDGNSTRYLGRELRIKAVPCDGNDCSMRLSGDELLLHYKTGDDKHCDIEAWLKKQAETVIVDMAKKQSSKIGVKYSNLRIRSARTRWGSCSPTGNLNFNWKLIIAPLPVIEYVVIHELCHLKELNHSKAFWGLVQKYCPGWRAQRKWLRENEAALSF